MLHKRACCGNVLLYCSLLGDAVVCYGAGGRLFVVMDGQAADVQDDTAM